MKKFFSIFSILVVSTLFFLSLTVPEKVFAGRGDSCSSEYTHTFSPSQVLLDTDKITISGVDGPLQAGQEYYIELESLTCNPERSTSRVVYTGSPMTFTYNKSAAGLCAFVGGEVTYRLRRRNPGFAGDVDVCILGKYNPVLTNQIAASCKLEISPSPASVSMPITVTGKAIKNSAGELISNGKVVLNAKQTGTLGTAITEFVDVSNGQFSPINIGTLSTPGSWTIYVESYSSGYPNICSQQIDIHEFIDPDKPPPEPVGLQPYDPGCTAGDTENVKTALGCLPTNPFPFVNLVLPWATLVGAGIAFLLGVFGAFMISISAGNPEKMQAGRELITSAIGGLLLIIFAIFILKVIGVNILGLFIGGK